MIRLRLFPCNTTCAWDIRSSGTNGAGTDAMGRELLPLPPPIITPGGPPIRPPLLFPPPLLPPRIAELLRIIRARERDIPALLPLPLLPLPFGAELEFPT